MKTLIENGKKVASGAAAAGTLAVISKQTVIIATYALCNFANIGSIGITISGIAGIAPNRQPDLARMGVRSMIGGLLAGFMTAAIAGML